MPVPDGLVEPPPPHGFVADEVFRGLTAAMEKSDELLSVSVHPPFARKIDVVLLLGPVAGPAPSKKFAFPHPTKSTICARSELEQTLDPPLHVSPVVVFTSTTFPALPPILMLV